MSGSISRRKSRLTAAALAVTCLASVFSLTAAGAADGFDVDWRRRTGDGRGAVVEVSAQRVIIGMGQFVSFQCRAAAHGNIVTVTRIEKCSVKSTNDGTVNGIAPITWPGKAAYTIGMGTTNPGSLKGCVTVTVAYLGTGQKTGSACGNVSLLP